MRFNLGISPPAIKVTVGSESFQLQHRYLTDIQRAEAVQAVERSISLATELLGDAVTGWAGVEDEDGTPMLFSYEDAQGIKRTNLHKVMGRVPWKVQLRTMLVQFVMNGVAFSRFREILATCVDDPKELDAFEEEMKPFLLRARGLPTEPAGEPSAPATSGT
jgi:hypothetical protein